MKRKKILVPTVDAIIEYRDKIVLVKRTIERPFTGGLAIPGGKVEYGETVEAATIREAKEETGLKIRLKEILGVYSHPKRHPWYQTIGTIFVAEPVGKPKLGGKDAEARWFSLKEIKALIKTKKLSFDHAKILSDYLKWRKTRRGTWWSGKK